MTWVATLDTLRPIHIWKNSIQLGAHHVAAATNHFYLGTSESDLVLRDFGEILIIEVTIKFYRKTMVLLFYDELLPPLHLISSVY